jgi:hypothetical protein
MVPVANAHGSSPAAALATTAPARKGRIVTRGQTVTDLEQDLKDRYPDAQVTVTGQGGSVTVAVSQPDDSIRLKTGTDRIRGGSALLARVLRSRNE